VATFASVVLIGLGALVVTGNWFLVVRWWAGRKRGSMVPFVGGVFVAVGLAMALDWRAAAVPLVLDPGTGWLILGWPILRLSRRLHVRERV